MQNEPNFQKVKMNINKVLSREYENKTLGERGKSEPKRTQSKPIKANLPDDQMNVNPLITKDYRKNDAFAVQKNKPKTNPISEKLKMNVTSIITKDYENKPLFRVPTKQSQYKPNPPPKYTTAPMM